MKTLFEIERRHSLCAALSCQAASATFEAVHSFRNSFTEPIPCCSTSSSFWRDLSSSGRDVSKKVSSLGCRFCRRSTRTGGRACWSAPRSDFLSWPRWATSTASGASSCSCRWRCRPALIPNSDRDSDTSTTASGSSDVWWSNGPRESCCSGASASRATAFAALAAPRRCRSSRAEPPGSPINSDQRQN